MKKITKYFIPFYIIFIILSYFYVASILKEGEIVEYDPTKISKDKKEATVTLVIEKPMQNKSFQRTLYDKDSVSDLLEDLREEKLISYETTEYSTGTSFDILDGVKPKQGYRWALFLNEEEITSKISDVNLVDETIYYIRLTEN